MAKKTPSSRRNSLVIVESPAKARTIGRFLGRGYTIEASIGHVRDLPQGAKEIPQRFKGEDWAYRLAMALYALPSIGGMFMFLPYISFVGGFPLPMVVSWIGLAGFISFIFLRHEERKVKWTRFATLLLIGMLATHAFVIGIGAQRTMWTRPGHPLYPDFTWWLFNWVGEVNWIAVILLYLSIPFLAVGNRKGWWLATIGAVAILPLNVFTQIFRTKTFDYLIGAVLAAAVLIFTQIPALKKRLLKD